MKDTLGQAIIFDTYKFEVTESDIQNKLLHQVAIHYITAYLFLYEMIGDNLLLSYCSKTEQDSTTETFLLKMQPGLSISNYQRLQNAHNFFTKQFSF